MKVAVSVCSDNTCTLYKSKYCFGLVTGMKFCDLDACICLKNYVRDIMLSCHGMLYGTNGNSDDAVLCLHYGNMLLYCSVSRGRDKLLHLLTATYYRNIRVHDLDDDIAAMLATIKCDCHKDILLDMH